MIKPAYSVSFLLSINIFVWQNVLYFLDAPRVNLVDLGIDDRLTSNELQYSRMCAVWIKLRFTCTIYEEGPSIQRLGTVHVGFVLDKVALRKVILLEVLLSPVSQVPSMIRTDFSLTDSTLTFRGLASHI